MCKCSIKHKKNIKKKTKYISYIRKQKKYKKTDSLF